MSERGKKKMPLKEEKNLTKAHSLATGFIQCRACFHGNISIRNVHECCSERFKRLQQNTCAVANQPMLDLTVADFEHRTRSSTFKAIQQRMSCIVASCLIHLKIRQIWATILQKCD